MKKTKSKGKNTKTLAKKEMNRAAESLRKLWLADTTWPPKGELEKAMQRLVDVRADLYIAEWDLGRRRIRPFLGGWLLHLPDDADAGSVVISLPLLGLGERVKAVPERMKPAVVEVVALAENAVPPTVESLIGVYEDGDLLNAYFFAVADGRWECMDIERFLRITAEEVMESGGPLKAYREDYGALDDLRLLRLYKKSVEFYRRGVI